MSGTTSDPELRDKAALRLKKRRDFYAHLAVYVMVNGFLIIIWATMLNPGFFWPVFPLFGWGIGLAMHAWDVFVSSDITEEDIDREVARMRRG